MTEQEFWQTSPRVYRWRVEAFLRQQQRFFMAAGMSSPTPMQLFSSTRLGEGSRSEFDQAKEIDLDSMNWAEFEAALNQTVR